jgi:amidase
VNQSAAVPTDPLRAFVIGPALLESGVRGGLLTGVRFAVKDIIDVAGTRTGAGNPDWLADAPLVSAHAPVVAALLSAGADLWGKTVTDELAYSLSGTNVHYGTPINTAAPGHVPGGSSSGSAAAVAGGAVALALGSDTGGSTRIPASYCGIYGLRTSHRRISLAGVVPLAPNFDTVGLFAADAGTLATAFRALAARAGDIRGESPPGATTTPRTIRRLVVATDLMDLADDGAADVLRTAAALLGDRLGLAVVEMPLGAPGQLSAWRNGFQDLQQVEAWRSDGDWLTSREPTMGPGIAERFDCARSTDPARAQLALSARVDATRAFRQVMAEDGLLLQPAASGPAPLLDTDQSTKDDLRARTLTLTAPAGMAGAPVVSLPLAEVDSLPVGLALVGLPGDDEILVGLAQQAADSGDFA